MPITVADLTAHAHLGLRIVWADEQAAARPWNWVHSSDLADPTPFLGDGDALLTTGTQWNSDDEIEPWVARLAVAGVPGVGVIPKQHRHSVRRRPYTARTSSLAS